MKKIEVLALVGVMMTVLTAIPRFLLGGEALAGMLVMCAIIMGVSLRGEDSRIFVVTFLSIALGTIAGLVVEGQITPSVVMSLVFISAGLPITALALVKVSQTVKDEVISELPLTLPQVVGFVIVQAVVVMAIFAWQTWMIAIPILSLLVALVYWGGQKIKDFEKESRCPACHGQGGIHTHAVQ